MYQMDGYNMLFQPRPDNQAGGVVIYMNSDLQYSYCPILLPTAEIVKVVFNFFYTPHALGERMEF
ncbi:hypothetical protein J6590_079410 [Homalodisca vitripennis]|nr:hypothetical protein J6590_079410 [Homalodisca vitripennis]